MMQKKNIMEDTLQYMPFGGCYCTGVRTRCSTFLMFPEILPGEEALSNHCVKPLAQKGGDFEWAIGHGSKMTVKTGGGACARVVLVRGEGLA